MYGADGWVLHHNTDIWRINGPIDGSFWGMWPMGGAWLCQHLFEKYEYNGDKEYLKSVYPVMKGAVEFYLSFLLKSRHIIGWLFVLLFHRKMHLRFILESSISEGTTMDNQLAIRSFYQDNKSCKNFKYR